MQRFFKVMKNANNFFKLVKRNITYLAKGFGQRCLEGMTG
jgi:hypothetical protein